MQSLDRLFELLRDDALAHHDLLQPFTKPRRRDTAVSREFHEALFLSFQIAELSLQRRLGVGISVDHALERLREQLPQLPDDVGVEAYELELVDDLILDVFDPEAGRGATNAVTGGAGVVLVRSAVAGVLAVHEPTETPGGVAGAADKVPPQVMEVLHVAVAIAVARVKDRLHLDEEFLRHDGLMPTGEEASLITNDPGVVRVAEDLGQARLVDRTSRAAR
ncbi:hypothetical protein A4X17_05585 [Plantibacter sp. H53]|nr:hypothetical protein [Plantibacter sp. H53]OAN29052.1 hypothetical protein A4X17_05585 [Plantibacter sp. H53]